jgi:chromosome segregation ATPase
MSNVGSEWGQKLQDALTEIKISSANVEARLEQLMVGMQKLESSLEDMKSVTSNQETRLQLLEAHCARIPNTMGEDFAIMKTQLASYRKASWMVVSVVVGLVIKTLFDMAV